MGKLIALLTDFGTSDIYVGVMKAVMKNIYPSAEFIDISHEVKPQSIHDGAFMLRNAYQYFPKDTVFLVVIDPTVGSKRRPILVETEDYRFIAPDNGILTPLLADIDNFKKLNDTYGHLVGDDVLKVVANELGQNLRNIDIVGRWGGEEFIFILPDTDAKKAQLIVDRIRVNIANIPFTPASTSKQFNVTVSFGISESSIDNIELEEILDKADKALYNAKINGRNQVVVNLE